MPDDVSRALPDDALEDIRSVLSGEPRAPSSQGDDRFVEACRRVAAEVGIDLPDYLHIDGEAPVQAMLARIASKGGFGFRRVTLDGEWWRTDNGPMLVFRQQEGDALAALYRRDGGYELVGPEPGQRARADGSTRLEQVAYMFYRILPGTPVGLRSLLRLGLHGLRSDVVTLLTSLALAGVLALGIPLASAVIVDMVIPSADTGLLGQLILLLACLAGVMLALNIAASVAVARFRLRMTHTLALALWDRLLRLPAGFFRSYTAGDLAERADAIDEIQDELSGNGVTVILCGIFSLVAFGLMAYYDPRLAALAVLMTAIYLAGIAFLVSRQLGYDRSAERIAGQRAGFLVQLLSSIAKLRMAGGERSAFNQWMKLLTAESRHTMRSERWQIGQYLWGTLFLGVSTSVLFVMVVSLEPRLSVGSYVAFSTAWAELLAAVFALGNVVSSSLNVIPLYERARPILQTSPEDRPDQIELQTLRGGLEVRGLSFRYETPGSLMREDTRWVLENLTLDVKPGELVALVGPSGSGKSTLFQLLLGFERAQSGTIHYDGHDLNHLDLRSLRRLLGVVLQQSEVSAGTIEENILGGDPTLTPDDAWNAAYASGLAEEIGAMPMQMYTMVAEGGRNLSAGQRQRLLLARAFARSPCMMLLDEATSRLDNKSQAWVFYQLKSRRVSCLLAAHRLSTLRYADRVYVMDSGLIVQRGSYAELLASDGLFARLAERQVE